jgi:tetratricopeptide (TPR) repeat protein
MGVIGTGVGLFRARSALAASRAAEATATRFLREVTAARAISDARNLQLQGEDRLRHGRFTEAAADFAHAIELDPSVHWSWYLRVTILAYQGDAAAYRAECSAMFSRFGGAGDWSTVDRTVKACLLLPPPIDPGRVAELARRNLEIAKRMDYSLGEAHFSQALALLRAGDYRESLDVGSIYGAADKLHLAINDLLSVMDLEHLHRHEEAMLGFRWGEGLVAQLPKAGQDDPGENPEDWLICQVLLREAQAVVASASDTTNPEHARNDRSHAVTSTARWNGQPGKPARVTEGAK